MRLYLILDPRERLCTYVLTLCIFKVHVSILRGPSVGLLFSEESEAVNTSAQLMREHN